MNLVGKIFVFLIFIMSLVFMSFAVVVYATQTNWRDAINNPSTGYKARRLEMDKQLEEQVAKNGELSKQIILKEAQKAQALAKEHTANIQLAEKTKAVEEMFANLTKANADANAQLAAAEAVKKTLTDEVESLRAANRDARNITVAQVKKASIATEKINQVISQVAVLTDRKKQLEDQLALYKRAIDAGHISLELTPPKTKGEIVSADEKEQMAMISLGTDDGFQAGNQFDVVRGPLLISRLRLVSMEKNRAVGVVVKEYKKGQILKGDNVIPIDQNKK